MGPKIEFPASVPELAERLDREGIVCLEDVVSSEWLEAARKSVNHYIAKYGSRDFLVSAPGEEVDTPAHELVGDRATKTVLRQLTAARWPRGNRAQAQIANGLAVRSGSEGKAESSLFHYDGGVVTMLVPIFIPDAGFGRSGDLVAVPNKRPFRRFLVSHAFDKALTHNAFYRRWFARRVFREPQRYLVDLKPGNVYLFWGYRTLHGNLPCAPDLLRATLILHYGEPHRDSATLSLARSLSRRRLMRRMEKAGLAPDPAEPTPQKRATA
jgi:hypothetical protein